jgi:hypothetical protein
MLRKSAGNYHDIYRGVIYKVFRDRTVEAGRIAKGWRFQIGSDKSWSQMHPHKDRAAFQARVEISRRQDEAAT